MLKSKVFDDVRWDNGVTFYELMLFMVEENIPMEARIKYAGCGSHMIEFVWGASPEEEKEIRAAEEALQKIAVEKILDQRRQGLIA